jgi:hypothetical protein
VPDVFFFNPYEYFRTHPNITAIFIEDVDDPTYSVSSGRSDPADIVTVPDEAARLPADARSVGSVVSRATAASAGSLEPGSFVLIIKREEYTAAVAYEWRAAQHFFFTARRLELPSADQFLGTLHGR